MLRSRRPSRGNSPNAPAGPGLGDDRARTRRARTRWVVPAAAVGAAAVGLTAFAVAPQIAGASTSLRPRTAEQLLTAMGSAQPQALSGTVVETANLGLPALGSAVSGTSLTSLLTGSHTLRVWLAGGQRERLAILGSLAESDVVRNGGDAWIWSSASNSAEHLLLPTAAPGAAASASPMPSPTESLTPQQAAAEVLAALAPTTVVSVTGTTTVAGRSAYELQLQPKQTGSLVDRVDIAVDSATSIPLRVQVFAVGATTPAFSTAFTAFSLGQPDASVFTFTPPPGATVTTKDLRGSTRATPSPSPTAGSDGPTVVGTGWTSVVELPAGAADSLGGATGSVTRHHSDATGGELSTLLMAATPVSGAFGSGKLLTTSLLSVLVLDDGRILLGAVTPAVLEAAAA